MADTSISIRVDAHLKDQAEALFSGLGLSMSAAVGLFLRSAVDCNGIPSGVRQEVPNAETRAALAEFEEMKRNGRRYHSFDELLDEVFTDA